MTCFLGAGGGGAVISVGNLSETRRNELNQCLTHIDCTSFWCNLSLEGVMVHNIAFWE